MQNSIKNFIKNFISLIASYGLFSTALADTVIKCKEADGTVVYSQTACPGGQALEVHDERTPQQKTDADANTQRTEAQASALQQQRQTSEALLAKQITDQAARERLAAAQARPEPVHRIYYRRLVRRPVVVPQHVPVQVPAHAPAPAGTPQKISL